MEAFFTFWMDVSSHPKPPVGKKEFPAQKGPERIF